MCWYVGRKLLETAKLVTYCSSEKVYVEFTFEIHVMNEGLDSILTVAEIGQLM